MDKLPLLAQKLFVKFADSYFSDERLIDAKDHLSKALKSLAAEKTPDESFLYEGVQS